jgi:hypothetical protein
LNQSQISADSSLKDLQADITNSYSFISNAQIAAVLTKQLGLSTGYLIFFTQGQAKGWSVYTVVDNIKSIRYIISVNEVSPASLLGL